MIFGADGLWTGRSITVPDSDVALNVKTGETALDWVDDPHALRLVEGELVAYVPPAPDEDHEWNPEAKRWRLKDAIGAAKAESAAAAEAIGSEELTTLRALREWALSVGGGDAAALARLQAAEDRIKNERRKVK